MNLTTHYAELDYEFEKFIGAVWLLSTLYYLIMGIVFWDQFANQDIFLANFIFTSIYYSIIFLLSRNEFFSEEKLIITVMAYNFFFVGLYNVLFFLHHGDFLAFVRSDSIQYDYIAKLISEVPIARTISALPFRYCADDSGYVVYASVLYRIFQSNLTVNLLNILTNLATVVILYRIGTSILSAKGAFLAATIYGLATYTVFYQASGLKETIMIFLTIAAFYYFIKGLELFSASLFLLGAGFCALIVFFRVPIALFILISVGAYFSFKADKGDMLAPFITMISIIVGLIFFLSIYRYLYRYTQDFSAVISYKKTVFHHDIRFAGVVGAVSGIFGPFPTIIPFPGKENTSIFAGSLIFKVFISAFFIIGVYISYKTRNAVAIALSTFCFVEIAGLTYLLETLEFRKNFPHIGFFTLIAIYGFENKEMVMSKYPILPSVIFLGNMGLACAILAWNILRF